MDRREVLGLLIGAAVLPIRPAIPPSAGTVVHYADIAAAVQRGLLRPAEAASEFWANVAAEPKPAICLVEFGAGHDDEAVDRIVKDIRDVIEDTELDGVLVVGLVDGLHMTFLDANGRVCNRLLTDGGS